MKAFLSSLAILLIGAALTYYVNRKSADLRYQLSSPIPTGSLQPQNVQQLEIANVGNAIAQRLQIQVHKKAVEVSVIKDSEADTFKQYPKADGIEIIYDALPPGRTIKIVFTFAETALGIGDLSIKYQDGEAQAALASPPTPWYRVLLDAAFAISIIFYFWSSFHHLSLSLLVPDSRFRAADLLKRRKPIYLKGKDWQALRSEALKHLFDRPARFSLLTDWDGYAFLNSERPSYLMDEEWQTVIKSLRAFLSEWVTAEATHAEKYRMVDTLRTLLPEKRPINLPESLWLEEQNKVKTALLDAKLNAALQWDRSKLASALKEKRPPSVSELDWSIYTHKVARLYFTEVVLSGKEHDPSFSTDDCGEVAELQTHQYKQALYRLRLTTMPDVNRPSDAKVFLQAARPGWMDESDYTRLRDRATEIVDSETDRARNRGYKRIIQIILLSGELPDERPIEITEEDWTELCRIHDAAVNVAKANSKKAAELSQKEEEVANNRAKVLRQLDVIDTCLRDPSVLDRFEEYDTVFAPGNLANLKRLADLQRKAGENPELRDNSKLTSQIRCNGVVPFR